MGSRVNEAHIDAALTNYVEKLPVDQGFIGDWICPTISVAKETDKYWKYSREEMKTHQVHRADGAPVHELEHAVTTDTYACEEYGLAVFVTKRQMDNADAPIRPKFDGVEKIKHNLALAREIRIQSIVQTAANWTGSTTPSTKWDASGADIEQDILAAKQAFFLQSGAYPNVAVINDQVRDAIVKWLRNKPGGVSLKEWRSVDVSAVDMSGPDPVLAGLFGIKTWLVGRAMKDTAGIGVAESLGRVWGDDCTLLYVEQKPGFQKASACFTFQRRGYVAETWTEPARSGEYVRVTHLLVEKKMVSQLGYHLESVLT